MTVIYQKSTGLVKVPSIMSSKLQKSFPICQSIFGTVAILTTISCWTRFAAAAQYHEQHETQGEATIKTMRSYLPSDTLTESQLSQILTVSTVTAASSKAGTTSTVRPWPSSKFFRSVLSKSDNVVRRSRSKSARKNNRTGVQVVSSSKLTKIQASHENGSIGMHRVNKKVKDGVNHSNELDLHPISLPFYVPSNDSSPETRNINEKRIIQSHLKSDIEKTHLILRSKNRDETFTSQRQFSNALKHEREKQTASYLEIQSDNVTSSPPTSIVNAMTSNSEGFEHLNSPQVGFQYEIVVPPSILPPLKPKKPTINTSIYYVPTSTMPSSSNEYSSSERTTSLSSTSTVTWIKANETINAATTTPSQSHMQETKDAEAINQSYLNATQISLQPKPPTHPSQLGMHFDSSYNGKRSTGNKSGSLNNSINSSNNNNFQNKQLPFHPNANETRRREIKTNGPWTINHNPTTAAPIITSTFLPTVKGDGEQNWSENNLPAFTIYFPTTYPFATQPPQVSSITSLPKETEIPHESTFDSEGAQSNQSFHRLTFENHPEDGNGAKEMSTNHTLTFQRRFDGNQTAIIRRRNMFTVINKLNGKPSIHVERRNATDKTKHANKKITIVKGSRLPHKTKFSERVGLVKRPYSPTIDFLTGPDRSAANVERENDYFDEDDAQANLHHWIESEQGYSVKSSTELPRFTNLTWPYYVTSSEQKNTTSFQGSNNGGRGTPSSIALSVSSTSQRDQKIPDLNSQYEFYIPSAAADPLQKPILVTKRRNKTAATTSESWTRVPTHEPQATTEAFQAQHENSMDHISGHKSKIKQSHWGSIGVNVKAKSQKVKPFSQQLKHNQRHQHNIKVYESSTVAANSGNPKSTPSTFLADGLNKNPVIFSTSKHQKHFLTSPSSVSSWPIVGGHTEMASFVTAKTPTNIWYKPTINHFTAGVPINGTFFGKEKVINILPTTTMKPPTTRKEDVGDDSSVISNNKHKTFQGESNGSNGIFQKDYNREGPILFKVWNLVDGKLKLQNQREIPPWALQGYLIPSSGTILNLKQIPQALQPLVTDAMNKEVKGSHESNGNGNKPYTWRPLPILGLSSPRPTTTKPSTSAPGESFFDEEETDPFKVTPSQSTLTMGWSGEEKTNRPISINYVLWNNPASIYDQSVYLSTPTSSISTPNPFVHLSTPTPVSYFPLSPITSEVSPINAISSVIWHRPSISIPDTPTTTIKPFTTTLSQEKLELIFQNYFQYFSTPSPVSTSTTTTAIPLTNKVSNTYTTAGNSAAWNDLQKLILRLASASKNDNDKTSITLDKEKPENYELVTNVASIALIMSYLRNQYETTTTSPPTITSQQPSTTTANEVPDDMTPPHKDQLWATVYPLFQHYLNNPNFSFIPPPLSSVSPVVLPSSHLSQLSAFISSITPTPSTPIAFTEPTAPTGSGSAYTRFNHYSSYYPTVPVSATQSPITHITITVMPNHGATTQQIPLSKLGELDDVDFDSPSDKKLKTLLLIHKLKKKKKKFKKKKDKKKDKLKKALFGAALLHKVSKPLFNVVKQPSKYWLDLKFDIDFYELIKKKLFYWLAYRYMPVFMVLAFGLIPLTLSLVPLLYKFSWMKWWNKRSKTKYIKVKVPVPYPQPFPVHVYQPPPPPPHYGFYDHDDDHHRSHSPPPDEHFHNQNFRNEHNDHHEEPPFYIDAPSQYDHQFAADTTGTQPEENDKNDMQYGRPPPPLLHMQPPRAYVGRYPEPLNSFNYDQKHSSSTHGDVDSNHQNKHPFPHHPPLPPLPYDHEQDQEIHVHLHEDESRYSPQLLPSALSTDSSFPYTSYNKKDLQPYPVTKTYEMGFDIGQKLAGMTNKHDMEILKILIENKKAKINKLLDMWNLAKYGVAVATSTVTGTTPAYNTADKDYSTRRKRRRKRKLRQTKTKPTSDT